MGRKSRTSLNLRAPLARADPVLDTAEAFMVGAGSSTRVQMDSDFGGMRGYEQHLPKSVEKLWKSVSPGTVRFCKHPQIGHRIFTGLPLDYLREIADILQTSHRVFTGSQTNRTAGHRLFT